MKNIRTAWLALLVCLAAAVCIGCSNADFSPGNATSVTTESRTTGTRKAASTDTLSGAARPSTDPAFTTGDTGAGETSSGEAILDESYATGLITSSVNLRDAPSGSTITTISEGTEVEVLGRHGNWYHINNEGEEGYVYKNYISVDENADIPDETQTGAADYAVNGGYDGNDENDANGGYDDNDENDADGGYDGTDE